uniref:Putative ATP-dependent RNA helicase DHX30 (inferred by orthology to a human protein) n=1 Tax=Strongyloides venezuelensis TaxID=75913 RepID=A0A0K0G5F8_STRVS
MSVKIQTQAFEDYISGIKMKLCNILKPFLFFVLSVENETNSKFWSFNNRNNESLVSPLAKYITKQVEQKFL